MVSTLLTVLSAALQIWASKEKTKYIDELTSLERQYREENNKPLHLRDDARIDDLEFKLRQLARNFAATATRKDA